MIKITNSSKEFNELEVYLMTVSPAIESMKNVPDGTSIEVDGYLEFDDVKEDGTASHICSILTTDNKAIAFQSKTFMNSLIDIVNIMKDKPFSVIKRSGKTKAGRAFINCELDVTKL